MISIIVPIYNTEKYLNECVDSILAQTYLDIEVLLVDDGSTDSSLQICEKYEESDRRVRVFHKNNSGVSAARNLGLNNAKGEYISFCDSDDVLKPELYEVLMETLALRNVDRVCGGSVYLYPDGQQLGRKERVPDGLYSREDLLPMMVDDGTLTGFLFSGVYNSIFKKEIIEKNSIRFQENIRYNEDGLFSFTYALHSKNLFSVKSRVLYMYRQHPESATNHRPKGDKYSELHKTLEVICISNPNVNLSVQMKRRTVTIALWDILDCSIKDKPHEAIKYINEIVKKIPLDYYDSLKYKKMNRYKKVYMVMMKYKYTVLLYLTSKYLVPFFSGKLKR